ncbi:IclR family transcriptional regulator [Phenylobacterium terrae]|uniref:IclR family transcriptional regulator n=1 Tax=Phenylobacterium terrae TaxID=2665495 RepID=A0ABW4N3D0_9CAUL
MDTTVAKGMAVLELLARADGPLRLSAIAQRLELQKSNVHRLLGTLSKLGYVTQEAETGRYMPTLKLWELGVGVLHAHPARRAAAPAMGELHRATGETVSLTLLDGEEVLYLDKLLSPRPLRFTTRPGSRAPAWLTPSGKAMLAQLDDPARSLENTRLRWPWARDLDLDGMLAELAQVRRQGYAISEGDASAGVIGIAAAIPAAGAPAAITVSGPAERISAAKRSQIVEAVLHACARIAESAA